jgi:hypothetical protein
MIYALAWLRLVDLRGAERGRLGMAPGSLSGKNHSA